MSFAPMERGYSTPDFFLDQFQQLNHNDCPDCWIFMGKLERDGMQYDVYQNFVTGKQEERNARTAKS